MPKYESRLREGRFWNANGSKVAIVASATFIDDELFDWSAYIGGKYIPQPELIEWVAEHGCKIERSIAAVVFPDLPIERYRD